MDFLKIYWSFLEGYFPESLKSSLCSILLLLTGVFHLQRTSPGKVVCSECDEDEIKLLTLRSSHLTLIFLIAAM